MSKKGGICFFIILLLVVPFTQTALAQLEDEYVLDKTVTDFIPLFMNGHEGDLNWIEGYTSNLDIYSDDVKVGTATVQVMLLNPPMSLFEAYDTVTVKMVNSITGLGSFEVTALGISLGSSTSFMSGDGTLAWTGSLSNGTGTFVDIYGLSSGNAAFNLFTGQGSVKEIIRARIGY